MLPTSTCSPTFSFPITSSSPSAPSSSSSSSSHTSHTSLPSNASSLFHVASGWHAPCRSTVGCFRAAPALVSSPYATMCIGQSDKPGAHPFAGDFARCFHNAKVIWQGASRASSRAGWQIPPNPLPADGAQKLCRLHVDSADPRRSMMGRLHMPTGVSIYLAQRLLRQAEKLGAHCYKDIAVKFPHSCGASPE